MKVLHISRTMGQGGAEKVVYQLCKKEMGYVPIVASSGGFYVDELKKINVKHYIIPDLEQKNLVMMIKTLFTLLKIVNKEKVDIIHSHHRMAAFYSKVISLIIRRKRIYTAHNVFFDKKLLLRFVLKNSTIVAVGEGVKNNLVNFYKINSKDIVVIYNSIDPVVTGNQNQKLKKLNLQDKILIGNIGRLTQQKGIDVFIKAISIVSKNNKNVIGVIIGDGEERENLIKLTKNEGISENICFLGYQSNVLDIIDQLKFVVLSSRWEGLPLTPLEVFSRKKTIIATNISGNNEIIKHGYNGLLFEKDDIQDLVAKILDIQINDKKLHILENNAYLDFNNNYNFEAFIKKYNDIYIKILAT